jgi:hypothetical protein
MQGKELTQGKKERIEYRVSWPMGMTRVSSMYVPDRQIWCVFIEK